MGDALTEGKTTAIVPTGGIEPNGPYAAASKHNFVLSVTAEAIARELGDALVAPVVKFVAEGDIDEPSAHMRYHATLSVREDTFVFSGILEPELEPAVHGAHQPITSNNPVPVAPTHRRPGIARGP